MAIGDTITDIADTGLHAVDVQRPSLAGDALSCPKHAGAMPTQYFPFRDLWIRHCLQGERINESNRVRIVYELCASGIAGLPRLI